MQNPKRKWIKLASCRIPDQSHLPQKIAELEQQLAREQERNSVDMNDGNAKLVTTLADVSFTFIYKISPGALACCEVGSVNSNCLS